MKLVKKTHEYKIRQRRDGRYAVTSPLGQSITGEEKVKILIAENLIKATRESSAGTESHSGDENNPT